MLLDVRFDVRGATFVGRQRPGIWITGAYGQCVSLGSSPGMRSRAVLGLRHSWLSREIVAFWSICRVGFDLCVGNFIDLAKRQHSRGINRQFCNCGILVGMDSDGSGVV